MPGSYPGTVMWITAAPDLRERFRAESPNPNANGSEDEGGFIHDAATHTLLS
jgi:hypothetical protein